jgi:hypothetical protein
MGPGQAAGTDLSTRNPLGRLEFHVKSNDCGRGEQAGESTLNARSQKKYLAGLFQPGPTSNAVMLPSSLADTQHAARLSAKDAFLAADIGHIDLSTAQKNPELTRPDAGGDARGGRRRRLGQRLADAPEHRAGALGTMVQHPTPECVGRQRGSIEKSLNDVASKLGE